MSTGNASTIVADNDDLEGGAEVPIGSAEYNEVLQFLYAEARLLNRNQIVEWGELLHTDLVYTAPIRVTRHAADNRLGAIGPGHFDEDYASIRTRIARLSETKSFWAEDPPSRSRRFVANVLVSRGKGADELAVCSDLLVTRNRLEMVNYPPLSAERRDLLRRVDGKLKLSRREILIDQSVVLMPNLAIFL